MFPLSNTGRAKMLSISVSGCLDGDCKQLPNEMQGESWHNQHLSSECKSRWAMVLAWVVMNHGMEEMP